MQTTKWGAIGELLATSIRSSLGIGRNKAMNTRTYSRDPNDYVPERNWIRKPGRPKGSTDLIHERCDLIVEVMNDGLIRSAVDLLHEFPPGEEYYNVRNAMLHLASLGILERLGSTAYIRRKNGRREWIRMRKSA